MLRIKSKESCRWDIVSLGEVMLRLDPGDKRIHTTRSFELWEGGGDSFASGLIYGFLSGEDAQFAVNCGAGDAAKITESAKKFVQLVKDTRG